MQCLDVIFILYCPSKKYVFSVYAKRCWDMFFLFVQSMRDGKFPSLRTSGSFIFLGLDALQTKEMLAKFSVFIMHTFTYIH